MDDQICGLCGIRFVDGSYRFSYRPDQPISKDAVYTRVCRSVIDAQKKRTEEGETDLPPIALEQCINTIGQYNKKYRWLKPNEAI